MGMMKGIDRNTDRRIYIMRKARSTATTTYSNGGKLKRDAQKAKPVTLPTLDTARKITREEK